MKNCLTAFNVFFLSFICFFASAAQSLVLSLDENIKFLVVNGEDRKSSFLQRYEQQDLAEGENQIVIRFDGEVKNGSRDSIYTSKPYLFSLDLNGRDATITTPKTIRSMSQAKSFFRNPSWVVTYSDGSSEILAMTQLNGDGFGGLNDAAALVATYNQENGIIIDDSKVLDLKEDVVSVDHNGDIVVSGDAVAQLKLWYTKATEAEKVEFKVWLAQQ